MRNKQPVIHLPYLYIDKLLIVMSFLIIITCFIVATFFYQKLPDEIPMHFNIKGEVDRLGSKVSIFFIPGIAFITILPMLFLSKYPHTFNYPVKIDENNAKKEYSLARSLMIQMTLAISIILLYVTVMVIYSAFNATTLLRNWDIIIILGIIFTPIIHHIWKRKK